MTSVVVRTTANQCSWCKVEDVCYYSCSLTGKCVCNPPVLNQIATFAAVLLLVGYKLANPKTIIILEKDKIYQFIPFIATFLLMICY
jgi:hypothetical protein